MDAGEGGARVDAAAGEASFGLLRVGDATVALAVASLREVVPCPARLDALPRPVPALLGALSLRGTVIPVLDLGQALGMAARGTDSVAAVVVIALVPGASGRRLIGLKVDAVCGMVRLGAAALLALDDPAETSGTPDAACARLVTHSFVHEGTIVTVIDAPAIAALPGVPSVAEAASGETRAAQPVEPTLLFGCGEMALGVAALAVDATVPTKALQPSPLQTELCVGVVEHHGQNVPVVDTLRLLGLGRSVAPGTASVAVLVLRFAEGRLALTIDSVSDIVRPTRSEVLPMPPWAVPHAQLFAGVLGGAAGQQVLLLDAAALLAHPQLGALAGMSRVHPGAGAASAAGAAGPAADTAPLDDYLTFDIGVEAASPLLQISEILPFPGHATPLAGGEASVLGLFTHRGRALPLVCLATLLGEPGGTDRARSRVLVVQRDADADGPALDVGFVVQGLRSIERARWSHAGSGRRSVATGIGSALIEVGHDALRRTLPLLDLRATALRVAGAAR